jgi:hypothetical protein
MKFLNGSLITNPRGSIGGITFSQGPAGNFARERRIPINKKSVAQLVQRSLAGRLSQYAKSLSTSQINDWKALSLLFPRTNSLHQTYYLTWLQLFLYINIPLYIAGQTILDDPPDISSNVVTQLSSLAVVAQNTGLGASIVFTWTAIVPANFHPFIFASFPYMTSKKAPDYYKLVQFVSTNNSSGQDISATYAAKVSSYWQPGQKIFFKIYVLDYLHGWRSQEQFINTIVTV